MKYLNYVNAFPLIFAVSLIQASDKPQGADIVDKYIEERVKNNVSGSIKPDAAFVTRVLSSQELANYFFSQLNQYPLVTALDLSFIGMGDNGAQRLAEALYNNKTVMILDLRANNIKDSGAQALAEMLAHNSTLTTLDVGHNDIGDVGAQHLAVALGYNKTIMIFDLRANKIEDAGAQALAEMLAYNSTLTTLDVGGNNIGDSGAQAFVEMLPRNKTLTTLDILFNRNIKENFVTQIEELISHNKSRQTTLLTASDKPQGADIVDKYIEERVKSNVSGSIKPDAAFVTRVLSSQELANYFFSQLNQYPGVSALDLSFIGMGDKGAQCLAAALYNNKTVTSLYGSGNNIRDAGAQALAEMLTHNSTLEFLSLGLNIIGDAGAQSFAAALKKNTTLKTLALPFNRIRDVGAQDLAEMLKHNSTLTTLALAGNTKIGDTGVQSLSRALQNNTTLTNLFLNSIGNAAFQAVVEMLFVNKALKFLDLHIDNTVSVESLQSLLEALKHNFTLTSLTLSGAPLPILTQDILTQINQAIDRNKKQHRSLLEHHTHQELLPENREASDEATKIGYEAIEKYGK